MSARCISCGADISGVEAGVQVRSLKRGVLGVACNWEHAMGYYTHQPDDIKGSGYTMHVAPLVVTLEAGEEVGK